VRGVHLPRGARPTQPGARGRRQPGAPVRHAGDAFEGSRPCLGKYWPRPGAGHPPVLARAGPGPGGEDAPRPACGRLGVSARNRPPAVGPCWRRRPLVLTGTGWSAGTCTAGAGPHAPAGTCPPLGNARQGPATGAAAGAGAAVADTVPAPDATQWRT